MKNKKDTENTQLLDELNVYLKLLYQDLSRRVNLSVGKLLLLEKERAETINEIFNDLFCNLNDK